MSRVTKVQREILTLMASGTHRQGECSIVEDYDNPGWIYLEDIEPERYVHWGTVKILEREGLIFDAHDHRERYRWSLTEAGRALVTPPPAGGRASEQQQQGEGE